MIEKLNKTERAIALSLCGLVWPVVIVGDRQSTGGVRLSLEKARVAGFVVRQDTGGEVRYDLSRAGARAISLL
jgi:hypothetical protein